MSPRTYTKRTEPEGPDGAQAADKAMSDDILTREEEERLRTFRDSLALENSAADPHAIKTLNQASSDRIMTEARQAAISVDDGDQHLQELVDAIGQADLDRDETNRLLIRAWEAAVEGALEDGLVSLGEENALAKYADHFNLTQEGLDGNGAQTTLVQAAVIREVTEGIIPQRQNVTGTLPFNLMESETLVWVMQNVDHIETVVHRGYPRDNIIFEDSQTAVLVQNSSEAMRVDMSRDGELHRLIRSFLDWYRSREGVVSGETHYKAILEAARDRKRSFEEGRRAGLAEAAAKLGWDQLETGPGLHRFTHHVRQAGDQLQQCQRLRAGNVGGYHGA